MVGGVVFVGGRAWGADDQHDPLLQLQGYSLVQKAAIAHNRVDLSDSGSHLAVLGVCAGHSGLYLHGGGRRAAADAFHSPPAGFADRVIHACL